MARRAHVFTLLLVLSVAAFNIYMSIIEHGDIKNNRFVKIGTTGTSFRALYTASNQYVDSLKSESRNKSDSLPPISNHQDGIDGLERGTLVRETCEVRQVKQANVITEVLSIQPRRLVYCPVEKISSTFWRRVFYMVYKNKTKYVNPYDVPIETALASHRLFNRKLKIQEDTELLLKNSFSFLFVRNPYSRLLSAFVDKLLGPNPYYWKLFGVKAIKAYRKSNQNVTIDGHTVTFAEFVRHVVDSENKGRNLDSHFISIMKSCRPCQLKFDYIGKMETFQEDSVFIMNKAGINTSVDSIKNRFSALAVDDAIFDSIKSPFSWKKTILKSISWEQALQRIWLKLQMRGIIAMDKKLEITANNINMSEVSFIELARRAHRDSDPADLRKTRTAAMHEAFRSVPLDTMRAFRNAFQDDFKCFGYNDTPSYIFDRNLNEMKYVLFNYTHLN